MEGMNMCSATDVFDFLKRFIEVLEDEHKFKQTLKKTKIEYKKTQFILFHR